MGRRSLLALVFGWLLGLGTAAAMPELLYERQTIFASGDSVDRLIEQTTQQGWRITRADQVRGPESARLFSLERPRLRLP